MKYLFFAVVFSSLVSCTMQGEIKGLFSYYKKTNELAPGLFRVINGSICELSNDEDPVVYVINGNQVRECLSKIDRALIYYWGANCSSSSCISLDMAQLFADRNDLELFVVAEYYDLKAMNREYSLKRPIFGIDIKYHSSNFTKKYSRRFFKDVFEFSPDLEHYKQFVYLENGEWKACFRNINDFETSQFVPSLGMN